MKAQWQNEKDAIRVVSDLKQRLEEARGEEERAQRDADLQRAAELRYGEIPELEKQLAEHEAAERERGDDEERAAHPCSSRRRSTPTTWPRWWRAGPGSRSAACSRARCRS